MARKPRWGLIILGIVLFVLIVGAALIGTVAYIGYTQFSLHRETTADPEAEFAKAEARFAGQQPLVEIPRDGPPRPIVHRDAKAGPKVDLTSLHLLAWDPEKRELVQFTMPFWLVRLGGRRPFMFENREGFFAAEDLQLTAEDIERHGPGLIVDYQRHGYRALLWAE
jgi:hypothetical protein